MIEITNDQLSDLFHGQQVTLAGGRVATYKANAERERDSYGEFYSYGDDDVWLVFQVGETYYKKYGTQDSYGHVYWDGGLKEVKPQIKTIEVWG